MVKKKFNLSIDQSLQATLYGPYSLLYTHLSFIAISWCICSNLNKF